jgi:hypothetical protein
MRYFVRSASGDALLHNIIQVRDKPPATGGAHDDPRFPAQVGLRANPYWTMESSTGFVRVATLTAAALGASTVRCLCGGSLHGSLAKGDMEQDADDSPHAQRLPHDSSQQDTWCIVVGAGMVGAAAAAALQAQGRGSVVLIGPTPEESEEAAMAEQNRGTRLHDGSR